MNPLIYLFVAMVVVFVSYVSFIWAKYGILPSISDSYYHLPQNLKPLFTAFCWGFALPAAIIGFSISEGLNFQFLMFFAAGGIMFVGASPDFKHGLDRIVHYVSAIDGVVFSQLFILVVFPQLYLVSVIFVVLSLLTMIYKSKIDEIWWIEIFSFISISYVFGINLI